MANESKFHVQINNEGVITSCSTPLLKTVCDSIAVTILGSIDFMADYRSLGVFVPIDAQMIDVIRKFCTSQDLVEEVHRLTELIGSYIVIVEQGGVVSYIYTSGEIDVPVYCGRNSRGIVIDTSWQAILKKLDQVELSRDNLEYFLRRGSCQYPKTLFQNLWHLKPYALYAFRPEGITLIMQAFPGFHTIDSANPPQYDIDDYLKAVACYKDHYNSFDVAYSGGPDSHGLASLYNEKVSQLLTVDYKEPYADLQRKRERVAGAKAAQQLKKKYPNVTLDFSDVDGFNRYYRHFVDYNPFSAFFAIFCYSLASHSDAQVLLSGQSADNMWDWGLHQIFFLRKGSHSTRVIDDIAHLVQSSPVSFRTRVRRTIGKYLTRFVMIHSFERERFKYLDRFTRYFGPEFDCMQAFPYKKFVLQRYVNYCTSGETMAWVISARYFSIKGMLPYISPLALHVNSHIKRRDYFDIKAPLRHRFSEFDPTRIKWNIKDPSNYQRWFRSPFFDQLEHDDLGQRILGLRAKLGVIESRYEYPMQEIHLYHLIKIMEQESIVLETALL